MAKLPAPARRAAGLILPLLLLAGCGAPALPQPAPSPSATTMPSPAPPQTAPTRLVQLELPAGEPLALPALTGSREVGFEQYRANSAYTLLAFREGRVVFETWPSGTRWQDSRQYPYDDPAQLGVYTLGEGEARLLGPHEFFAAGGQRPVTTAGGLYCDLYIARNGELTGLVLDLEAGAMHTLAQWPGRGGAGGLQLSELGQGQALWYFSDTAPESVQAAYVVQANGEARRLFDTAEQPLEGGLEPLACVGAGGRVLLAGRYPQAPGQVYLRALDGAGRITGETALPVPERLQKQGQTDIAWMHAAGGCLFIAWASPADVFSVLRWQPGGWARLEYEEAPPLGAAQPALVGGRYAFFTLPGGLLALDVEQNIFYRLTLPPCGEGRAPGSCVLDEQGRLLWSDERAGDETDANARFYCLELPPLLEAAGGPAPGGPP